MNKSKFSKSKIHVLNILVLACIFWGLFFYLKNDKINVHADDIGYLHLQECIYTGHGFNECLTLENKPHHHYNPGLPFAMAASRLVINEDISHFKYVNGALLCLYLIGTYLLLFYLSRSVLMSMGCSLLLVSNQHLLVTGLGYATEPLYFVLQLTVFGSFLFGLRKSRSNTILFVLLICSSILAFHVRNVGLMLMIAVVATLLFHKRSKKAAIYAFFFMLLSSPWMIQSKMGWSQLKQMFGEKTPGVAGTISDLSLADKVMDVWLNFKIYFLGNFQHLFASAEPITNYSNSILSWLLSLALLAGVIMGARKYINFKKFFWIYFILTIILLVGWRSFAIGFGVRYLTPFLPFFYLFLAGSIAYALKQIAFFRPSHSIWMSLLFGAVILYNVIGIRSLRAKESAPYSSDSQTQLEAAKFLIKNGLQDEILYANCCLFTTITSKNIYVNRKLHMMPGFVDSLRSNQINYVITNSENVQYDSMIRDHFDDSQIISNIDTIWEQENMKILRLKY